MITPEELESAAAAHDRVAQVLAAAFPANHPCLLDWAKVGFALRGAAEEVRELKRMYDGSKSWNQHLIDQCPYCYERGTLPCVLHGGAPSYQVIRKPDGTFRCTCPYCGEDADKIRSLERQIAAMEASHE